MDALSTVIVSLIAMRVRNTSMPFATGRQIAEVQDVLELPPELFSNERILRYYRGRLSHLRHAVACIHSHVQSKGTWVLVAQLLLVATLFALLVLFFAIVNETPPAKPSHLGACLYRHTLMRRARDLL
jgi:hypothetical protein